jgi:hydroxypyruvate isomerase
VDPDPAGFIAGHKPNRTRDRKPGGGLRRLIRDYARTLFDSYHTQIMEGNLAARFRAHRDVIDHVQIGNVPGRHEPDHGETDHRFLLSEMAASCYDGWIAGEYIPAGKTTAGLDWLDRSKLR